MGHVGFFLFSSFASQVIYAQDINAKGQVRHKPCPAPRGLANDKDVVADRPRKLRKLKPKDVFLENDEVSVEDEEVRATSEESSVDLTKKTFLGNCEASQSCEQIADLGA